MDEIRIGPQDGELMYVPETAVRLHAARIEPGHDRMIWVTGHLWTCDEQGPSYMGGSGTGFQAARIRFRVGLTRRQQLLELPTIVTIHFDKPSYEYCIHAVLDQGQG